MCAQRDERLQGALLELGLEDWIPIPEAMATVEARHLVDEDADVTAAVSQALTTLLERSEIALYRGHWAADPDAVSREEGLRLLEDPVWFSLHVDDPNGQRLCFVNVENIRSES